MSFVCVCVCALFRYVSPGEANSIPCDHAGVSHITYLIYLTPRV